MGSLYVAEAGARNEILGLQPPNIQVGRIALYPQANPIFRAMRLSVLYKKERVAVNMLNRDLFRM